MESHYCHQRTSKLYLEPVWLTFNSLYKFYESECKNNDEIRLSYKTVSQVIQSVNLSLTGNLPDEEYIQHVSKKIKAREANEKDKTSVGGIQVYIMDLQKVLLAPSLNASDVYYKTKLVVHNFTLFDLKTKVGYCYLWHESEGGITSNEFSSIICDII
ncbi:hypothetical protein PR048_013564 [Dryococelus australis]|uniref:Uncharacterized protein n=1 Tax=Dryococelus australis TaxID=614101 RepID=A0ABQ9HTD1_9NEOP|nr:hypothetical protein PR048_013564 [Dryococelus australis]